MVIKTREPARRFVFMTCLTGAMTELVKLIIFRLVHLGFQLKFSNGHVVRLARVSQQEVDIVRGDF